MVENDIFTRPFQLLEQYFVGDLYAIKMSNFTQCVVWVVEAAGYVSIRFMTYRGVGQWAYFRGGGYKCPGGKYPSVFLSCHLSWCDPRFLGE